MPTLPERTGTRETLIGEASTFVKMRLWDEELFDYLTVIDCMPQCDGRALYLALHAPPLIFVVWVRRGTELLRPGDCPS